MPTFKPPTHEEPMRTDVPPLRYYRLTWALSVVKVNGVYTSVRSPSSESLVGLEHGVDYFMGGHEYVVTQDVADALTLAGYGSGIS